MRNLRLPLLLALLVVLLAGGALLGGPALRSIAEIPPGAWLATVGAGIALGLAAALLRSIGSQRTPALKSYLLPMHDWELLTQVLIQIMGDEGYFLATRWMSRVDFLPIARPRWWRRAAGLIIRPAHQAIRFERSGSSVVITGPLAELDRLERIQRRLRAADL